MRHKFLVLTVKKWLKSVYIYGSYRKIKTGVPLFLDHSVHVFDIISEQIEPQQELTTRKKGKLDRQSSSQEKDNNNYSYTQKTHRS